MKKLALALALSSAALFTACSKPVTEVKKGEAAPNQAQTQTTALSTNNKADIQADVDMIQAFGKDQEAKAAPLEQKMQAAMQSQDKAQLNALLAEFKTFINNSNNELSALKLKSTEANNLRGKMIESSLIGLQMSELILTQAVDKVDPAQVQPLQEKAMSIQQDLMQISQDIHNKLNDTPAESATPTADAAQ